MWEYLREASRSSCLSSTRDSLPLPSLSAPDHSSEACSSARSCTSHYAGGYRAVGSCRHSRGSRQACSMLEVMLPILLSGSWRVLCRPDGSG